MGFGKAALLIFSVFTALALVAPAVFADPAASAFVVSTAEDRAGMWGNFSPGMGANGLAADWKWNATLGLDSTKTISSISITNPGFNEAWSTASGQIFGKAPYPLVVFRGGYQQNSAYDQELGLFFGATPAAAYAFSLYGQAETAGFEGGTIAFKFTDGTTATAQVPSSTIRPTQPVPANTAPRFSSAIPNRQYNLNAGAQANIVDVSAYAADAEQGPATLTYSIDSQGSTGAINCYISGTYIGCNAPSQTGTGTITVRATDSQGLYATSSFSITINPVPNSAPSISGLPDRTFYRGSGEQQTLYLPGFASDAQTQGGQLTFAVASQSDSGTIYCVTEGSYGSTLRCGPPSGYRAGSSDVTVRVTDPQGASATDSFTLTVLGTANFYGQYGYYNAPYGYDGYTYSNYNYNDTPRINSLPTLYISQNSGYRSNVLDLWNYAYDSQDSDDMLSFRATGQTNTGLIYCLVSQNRYIDCEAPYQNSTGTSTVTVQVEDSAGRSTSASFDVRVEQGYAGYNTYYNAYYPPSYNTAYYGGYNVISGYCAGIYVRTQPVYMNSTQTKHVSFDVSNNTDSGFYIISIQLSDNSPDISSRNASYNSYIAPRSTQLLSFDLESSSYSGARDATVYVDLRGDFADGRACSFHDSGTQAFTVTINGGNSQYAYGACGNTSLSVSDVTVPENSRQAKAVTIRNNSPMQFTAETILVNEVNTNFTATIDSRPATIGPNSSADIVLSIATLAVAGDKSGDVKVSVSGRFDDGRHCSTGAIYSTFRVTVQDTSYNVNYDSGSYNPETATGTAGIDIDLSPASVSLKIGESADVTATIRNNTNARQCVELTSPDARAFEVSLSKSSNICPNANSSESVIMAIKGNAAGSASAELTAKYQGTSKTRFVAVDVQGSAGQEPQVVSITASAVPSAQNGYSATIENTGSDLTDATISAASATDGVSFDSVSKELWRKGESVTLVPKIAEGFSGKATATVKATSAEGSREVPIEFNVAEREPAQGAETSGLVSLATTAGIGLGILVLGILAVLGIISLVQKKQ